jgi:hypothetical protein
LLGCDRRADRVDLGAVAHGRVALCLFAGAALPALVWAAGRFGARGGDTLWPIPGHPPAKVALGAAVALGAVLAATRLARLARRGGPGIRALAAAGVLLAAAAASLRWHTLDLGGDADFWVKLASHPFLMSSEPFGRWSHYFAYRGLAALGIGDRLLAVRLSSVLAGSAYLAGLLWYVPRALPRAPAGAITALLFVAPTSEIFAGHPETTPWVYALTGVYLLAGLRYLRADLARPPTVESLLLMAALFAHGVACFATGAQAALIATWLRRPGAAARRGRRLAVAALLAALPFAALAAALLGARWFGTGLGASPWYGNALGGGGGQWVWFSPGVSHVDVQYLFLDARHRRDLLNLVLFACPLLLVVPFAVADLARSQTRELAFLGSALAGLLLFALFWNADLGMRRDRDLMALFALPTGLIVALWLEARFTPDQARRSALATACATFAFRLVPFLRFP